MVTQKTIFGERELSPTFSLDDPRTEVYVGDCRDVLAQLPEESVDLVFADPPFNWNVPYADWKDNMKRGDYLEFTYKWLDACIRVLAPRGSLWVNIPDDSAAEVVLHLKARKLQMINWCIWHFRFGQCRDSSFIVSKVHVLYFAKDRKKRIWNPDGILESSDRAMRYNDARTRGTGRPGLRVPLDVWYGPYLGRIQGANKERRPGHMNQIPEVYMRRVILACSKEGGLVLDPFLGSGTTCTVARALNRRSVGIEFSEPTAKSAFDRIKEGEVRMEAERRRELRQFATEAYYRVSRNKYSVDDVVICDELNRRFIAACRLRMPSAEAGEMNKALFASRMNQALFAERKAGRLRTGLTTRRVLKHGKYIDAAGAAAREAELKLGKTLDEIMCNPDYKTVFDRIAQDKAPGVRRYRLRKAAMDVRRRGKLHS